MRIKVFGDLNHHVYGDLRRKAEEAFVHLGHQIVETKPDLVLTFGSAVHWNEIKDLSGRKVFLCHGVDWWKGFDSEGNEKIKSCWENCDTIVYSSRFAKHMAEKAFGKKEGIIVWNPAIPDFPEKFNEWHAGETIHIATCAIFRAWKRLYEAERLVKMINDAGNKVELHVIGKDGVPPEQYIHYYGIKNHDEIKDIYRKCHFYLHLAFNDYSPAVVGEAMAWGLPVMITNSGGSKDMVQDNGVILETDPFIDYPFNIHSL
jgi:glycosyltransferase involved in cell wall biosynthesis